MGRLISIFLLGSLAAGPSYGNQPQWAGSLAPIKTDAWQAEHLVHLLERTGFGATNDQLTGLQNLLPHRIVQLIVNGPKPSTSPLPAFEHSGVFIDGLDPFPASRPATTNLAKRTGEALGVKVKPSGNRPAQIVVNQFFYWLRASRLETDRVSYWWANRMLQTDFPLQEKMALFWHGHFAVNEDKVRDYRKMLKQVELLQQHGLGNFRTLLVGVAQDPAMLAFLDAGVNVKGSPNENFAREIMELFTMGVGNYSETDVREAARAFTGWNFQGLTFHIDPDKHDSGDKQVLGRSGNLSGIDVIDTILQQPQTAKFIASKIYRYFVRADLNDDLANQLGKKLRDYNYDIRKYLSMLLLSEDFYAPQSIGTRIKGPVELVVSTYKKMGLQTIPGVPDFNQATEALGQRLLHPPTVAGWSQGRSWITPSLLFERGNFALDTLFPDISFIPPDRYPSYGGNILTVQQRLRAGMDISTATKPKNLDIDSNDMAASNQLADKNEDFNTRYGSYRGWQMAIERVKPISRHTAKSELSKDVCNAGLETPAAVIDYFEQRYFSVALSPAIKARLAKFLEQQLGTSDIASAHSYAEEPLRTLLHLMLSLPEYQLG